jgi:hypothetical protein
VKGPADPDAPMLKGQIADGPYRYLLWRIWDSSLPLLGYCLLNPSKADAIQPDPTMTRCMGFAALWGYGGIVIANLYAWRATDKDELVGLVDPVGPYNDDAIRAMCWATSRVVMGWGEHPKLVNISQRAFVVRRILREAKELGHLGRNGGGRTSPRHPLYLPSTTQFQVEAT